jgi:hypothetical protein
MIRVAWSTKGTRSAGSTKLAQPCEQRRTAFECALALMLGMVGHQSRAYDQGRLVQ